MNGKEMATAMSTTYSTVPDLINRARSDGRLRERRRSSQSQVMSLSSSSAVHTLASLRFLILSYLADLEHHLTELESPSFEAWKLHGEYTFEEAKQRARTALEMLEGIRTDVRSHIPELPFVDLSSMEDFVRSHLPDLPEVPSLGGMKSHLPNIQRMRSHLPDMPNLPDVSEMRAHLPDMPSLPDMDNVITDMRVKLDDVRSRFNDIDFHKPFTYIPTLSQRLQTLQSYLSSTDVPSGLPMASIAPDSVLSNLLESLLNSDIVKEILESAPEAFEEGEDILKGAAIEVADSIKRSLSGVRLINYSDLPHAWRSNPFVTHGYRYTIAPSLLSRFLFNISQFYTYRPMASHY
jgi:adiponectin receptor